MRESEFVFESIDLLSYKIHKISLDRGGSYIDSPDWIKHKKTIINPKNKDNECSKYSVTAGLNYGKIKKDPQKISKIKPFINQYIWKDIDFPSHSKDWKKFEQNNKVIALNILFVPHNTRKIRPAYISKHNHKRDNQVILLMITNNNNEKWYYITVKNLSRLFSRITSNHKGDFYCLNCLHLYRTKEKQTKNTKRYAKIMIIAI